MTAIVGLVASGQVWLGGDSAACRGTEARRSAQPKVVRRGPLLLGAAGLIRHVNLLHSFDPPALSDDADVAAYIAGPVVAALRAHFKDAGRAVVNNSQETGGGVSILIGCRGRLFLVDDAYGVVEESCGFDAIGSGGPIAWGALYALHPEYEDCDPAPRQILYHALSAAAARDSAVAPPFTILGEDAAA